MCELSRLQLINFFENSTKRLYFTPQNIYHKVPSHPRAFAWLFFLPRTLFPTPSLCFFVWLVCLFFQSHSFDAEESQITNLFFQEVFPNPPGQTSTPDNIPLQLSTLFLYCTYHLLKNKHLSCSLTIKSKRPEASLFLHVIINNTWSIVGF